jgi:hypothetical protein
VEAAAGRNSDSLNDEAINKNGLKSNLFLVFIEVIGAHLLGKISKMPRMV